jgi:hypothetical protein
MKKFIDDLRSVEMSSWRKRGACLTLTFLSFLTPWIIYLNYDSLLNISLGVLLLFSAVALVQTLLAFGGSFYIFRNSLPKYVFACFSILTILVVYWSCIAIILISVKA